MKARVKATRLAASLAIGFALAPLTSNCWAQANAPLRLKITQEIAPFRLTGIDGYMVTRYLGDASRSTGPVAGAASRVSQSNLTGELFVMTHSYIYHPSLLSLDLGGGPVFDRNRYDTDGVVTNSKRQMYNLSARATVLRDKPYTGALFYDRQNQTQSIGPAQVMLTENTRYGGTFSLRNPVTPVPLQVDLTRAQNYGEGAGQIIDDRVDQLRLKLDANIGKLGVSAFQYVGTRQDSASGSAGLPIQASSSSNHSANLDTRLRFGSMNEYDLSNSVALSTNRYTFGQSSLRESTELKDFNFGLALRGRHSDELQSYGRYDFRSGKQNDQETTSNSASAGLSYRLTPDLSGSLGARAENNQASQFSAALYAIDGSAQYRRTLPLGQVTLGYNFAYSQRDQEATALQTRMLGERVTLSGTTLITLGNQQITAGSVVVSNLTRTQTFVEGLDYVLSQIGLSLRIQRLIGGNILDGQEVLTDYAFAVGGSYALSQLDNSVNLGWAYKSYLSVFVRYLDSAPRLVSGAPTSPINPVKSTLYGLRTEVPLSLLAQEFVLGGGAERENRRETILPYQRTNFDAYAQMDLPLGRGGNIRIGARQTQVDYDNNPAQAVKQQAYDMRLWSRVAYGIDLSVEASRERDTGAPVLRERSLASAKAQWRKRKLLFSFDLTRVRDAQGTAERQRTYGQVILRRDL